VRKVAVITGGTRAKAEQAEAMQTAEKAVKGQVQPKLTENKCSMLSTRDADGALVLVKDGVVYPVCGQYAEAARAVFGRNPKAASAKLRNVQVFSKEEVAGVLAEDSSWTEFVVAAKVAHETMVANLEAGNCFQANPNGGFTEGGPMWADVNDLLLGQLEAPTPVDTLNPEGKITSVVFLEGFMNGEGRSAERVMRVWFVSQKTANALLEAKVKDVHPLYKDDSLAELTLRAFPVTREIYWPKQK